LNAKGKECDHERYTGYSGQKNNTCEKSFFDNPFVAFVYVDSVRIFPFLKEIKSSE